MKYVYIVLYIKHLASVHVSIIVSIHICTIHMNSIRCVA
jgi:hypothetical protein